MSMEQPLLPILETPWGRMDCQRWWWWCGGKTKSAHFQQQQNHDAECHCCVSHSKYRALDEYKLREEAHPRLMQQTTFLFPGASFCTLLLAAKLPVALTTYYRSLAEVTKISGDHSSRHACWRQQVANACCDEDVDTVRATLVLRPNLLPSCGQCKALQGTLRVAARRDRNRGDGTEQAAYASKGWPADTRSLAILQAKAVPVIQHHWCSLILFLKTSPSRT